MIKPVISSPKLTAPTEALKYLYKPDAQVELGGPSLTFLKNQKVWTSHTEEQENLFSNDYNTLIRVVEIATTFY
jgi:hypothetical protein